MIIRKMARRLLCMLQPLGAGEGTGIPRPNRDLPAQIILARLLVLGEKTLDG